MQNNFLIFFSIFLIFSCRSNSKSNREEVRYLLQGDSCNKYWLVKQPKVHKGQISFLDDIGKRNKIRDTIIGDYVMNFCKDGLINYFAVSRNEKKLYYMTHYYWRLECDSIILTNNKAIRVAKINLLDDSFLVLYNALNDYNDSVCNQYFLQKFNNKEYEEISNLKDNPFFTF